MFSYKTKIKTNVGIKSDKTQCNMHPEDREMGRGQKRTGRPEREIC